MENLESNYMLRDANHYSTGIYVHPIVPPAHPVALLAGRFLRPDSVDLAAVKCGSVELFEVENYSSSRADAPAAERRGTEDGIVSADDDLVRDSVGYDCVLEQLVLFHVRSAEVWGRAERLCDGLILLDAHGTVSGWEYDADACRLRPAWSARWPHVGAMLSAPPALRERTTASPSSVSPVLWLCGGLGKWAALVVSPRPCRLAAVGFASGAKVQIAAPSALRGVSSQAVCIGACTPHGSMSPVLANSDTSLVPTVLAFGERRRQADQQRGADDAAPASDGGADTIAFRVALCTVPCGRLDDETKGARVLHWMNFTHSTLRGIAATTIEEGLGAQRLLAIVAYGAEGLVAWRAACAPSAAGESSLVGGVCGDVVHAQVRYDTEDTRIHITVVERDGIVFAESAGRGPWPMRDGEDPHLPLVCTRRVGALAGAFRAVSTRAWAAAAALGGTVTVWDAGSRPGEQEVSTMSCPALWKARCGPILDVVLAERAAEGSRWVLLASSSATGCGDGNADGGAICAAQAGAVALEAVVRTTESEYTHAKALFALCCRDTLGNLPAADGAGGDTPTPNSKLELVVVSFVGSTRVLRIDDGALADWSDESGFALDCPTLFATVVAEPTAFAVVQGHSRGVAVISFQTGLGARVAFWDAPGTVQCAVARNDGHSIDAVVRDIAGSIVLTRLRVMRTSAATESLTIDMAGAIALSTEATSICACGEGVCAVSLLDGSVRLYGDGKAATELVEMASVHLCDFVDGHRVLLDLQNSRDADEVIESGAGAVPRGARDGEYASSRPAVGVAVESMALLPCSTHILCGLRSGHVVVLDASSALEARACRLIGNVPARVCALPGGVLVMCGRAFLARSGTVSGGSEQDQDDTLVRGEAAPRAGARAPLELSVVSGSLAAGLQAACELPEALADSHGEERVSPAGDTVVVVAGGQLAIAIMDGRRVWHMETSTALGQVQRLAVMTPLGPQGGAEVAHARVLAATAQRVGQRRETALTTVDPATLAPEFSLPLGEDEWVMALVPSEALLGHVWIASAVGRGAHARGMLRLVQLAERGVGSLAWRVVASVEMPVRCTALCELPIGSADSNPADSVYVAVGCGHRLFLMRAATAESRVRSDGGGAGDARVDADVDRGSLLAPRTLHFVRASDHGNDSRPLELRCRSAVTSLTLAQMESDVQSVYLYATTLSHGMQAVCVHLERKILQIVASEFALRRSLSAVAFEDGGALVTDALGGIYLLDMAVGGEGNAGANSLDMPMPSAAAAVPGPRAVLRRGLTDPVAARERRQAMRETFSPTVSLAAATAAAQLMESTACVCATASGAVSGVARVTPDITELAAPAFQACARALLLDDELLYDAWQRDRCRTMAAVHDLDGRVVRSR